MKYKNSLIILLLTCFFSSCDNELKVNADYKETMVVYGLLDYTQPQQFIKINKAYLSTQNSAYVDAQIADSLYLDSVVAELIDNNGNRTPLTKTNIANKEDGIFTNDVNYFYTTNTPLNPTSTYHIEVKNPISENVVTSFTKLVYPPRVLQPISNPNLLWVINPNGTINFSFSSGINAAIYDVKVQFVYEEIQKSDTNVRDTHYLDWFVMKNRELANAMGNIPIIQKIDGSLFYEYIGSKIKVDNTVWRKAISGGTIFYGGGEEINTYLSVSKPSIGVVQKTTDYTNINNGIGIFSSRHIHTIKDIKFANTTKGHLRNDSRTSDLNFIN